MTSASRGMLCQMAPVQPHTIGAGLVTADDFLDHGVLSHAVLPGELLDGLDADEHEQIQKVVQIHPAIFNQLFLGQ